MPKSKRSEKELNGNDALESLLDDQAEARVQKEINISHGEGSSVRKKSGTLRQKGLRSRDKPSDIRKRPSARETKAQLIERMQRLLEEINSLEIRLEQEELEKENLEKRVAKLVSDCTRAEEGESLVQQELSEKNELLVIASEAKKKLEKTVAELQKSNNELLEQTRNNQRNITDLKKENQSLKSRITEMQATIDDLSSAEDNLKNELGKKDNEIRLLNQKIQNGGQDDRKTQSNASTRNIRGNSDIREQTDAFREKADMFWDGTRYDSPKEAIRFLNAGLELRPDWPEALNDRGLAYLDNNQPDKALDDFSLAIALRSDFAEAYHNRGVALLWAGKRFAAGKDFQAAAGLGLQSSSNILQKKQIDQGWVSRILKIFGIHR